MKREDGLLISTIDPGYIVERRVHGPALDGYLTLVTWVQEPGGGFGLVQQYELSPEQQRGLLSVLAGHDGALASLLAEVAAERARQDSMFGEQRLPDGTGGGGRKTWETIARNWCDRATREGILTFADILDEEVAEVLAETDPVKLRVELIQAAAVCLKWAQDLDRRAAAAKLEGGS